MSLYFHNNATEKTHTSSWIWYSSQGCYFITIRVKDFLHLFGEVRRGIMGFSFIGNAAALFLQQIPELRPDTVLDEFMIMRNPLHCILEIKQNKHGGKRMNKYGKPVAGSISVIFNQYKGAVTKWCKMNGFPYFAWHPRFYDHIIRDDRSYWNIKNYIINNPSNWSTDRFARHTNRN